MMRLLLKKQICMEVGYMLGSILLGICLTALCVGVVYSVYMAYWGVWNNE
jgi:predicted PurR-regulated permease PerM